MAEEVSGEEIQGSCKHGWPAGERMDRGQPHAHMECGCRL